ncbi:MAG: methylated-DNA--[protein]-cysteine S-methyltransferase [Eubacteriales bacterium]
MNEEKIVYYYTKTIMLSELKLEILTAVSWKGLFQLSIGEDKVELLEERVKRYFPFCSVEKSEKLNSGVMKQIEEFLAGERKVFDIILHMEGTEFQKKVWQELLNIPYGEVCSYSDIAKRINCPKGQRAVGMANNRNPVAIIVPCHRVIGKNGDLVGYDGGLNLKKRLLELENRD